MATEIPNKTTGEIAAYYKGLFFANPELLFSKKNVIELPMCSIENILNPLKIKLKYNYSGMNHHEFSGLVSPTKKKIFNVSVYYYNKKDNDLLKKTINEIQIINDMNKLITKNLRKRINVITLKI
ncbi:putative ORFan [Tupanvirus deep ocean]|uniref:ORFan n=2 Tax=Tupanvirus TaxID=2094720 RepID=A0AC62A9G4_9VIRU|nr:putative ORFan [Tupanvirus deep ocean]QKU34317.1 putative ORFan [Tupanvirus deep ocean]